MGTPQQAVLFCEGIVRVLLTGKSTLAQQLASRLNMPNVLQTDAIYEVGALLLPGPTVPVPRRARQHSLCLHRNEGWHATPSIRLLQHKRLVWR
jgi:cytidylate kinase